jgi:hypothetical protein
LPIEPSTSTSCDALVFRRHDPGAVFVQQAADDVGVGALRDFDDGAFRAAAAVDADDLGQHAVAMQHFLHFLLRQEQVFARLVRDHEAEAVAVAADAAGDEAGLRGQRVVAGVVDDDLAVALHRVQAARQDRLRLGGDFQRFRQARRSSGPLALRKMPRISSRLGMVCVDWFKSFFLFLQC